MALVRRANVILEVKDSEVQYYLDTGYSILNEDGSVKEAAVPSDINELREAYIRHTNEIKSLKAQIAELTKPKAPKPKER